MLIRVWNEDFNCLSIIFINSLLLIKVHNWNFIVANVLQKSKSICQGTYEALSYTFIKMSFTQPHLEKLLTTKFAHVSFHFVLSSLLCEFQ